MGGLWRISTRPCSKLEVEISQDLQRNSLVSLSSGLCWLFRESLPIAQTTAISNDPKYPKGEGEDCEYMWIPSLHIITVLDGDFLARFCQTAKPIGPSAYATQLPSKIKVLHKEPPKHLLHGPNWPNWPNSTIFKVHRFIFVPRLQIATGFEVGRFSHFSNPVFSMFQ